METVIVVVIVVLAVIYLVKRYLRIFRPRAQDTCECGCTGCDQEASGSSDAKTIGPRP